MKEPLQDLTGEPAETVVPRPPRPHRAAAPDWRRLLAGGRPRTILARLVQGDPLGVRRLVGEELRRDALLLDADRVHLRALARCARYAPRYDGRPRLNVWLRSQVRRAVGDLLREEARALEERGAAVESGAGAHADLARPLGLDPVLTRAACDAFNRGDGGDRGAFFALVVEGADLDEVARRAGCSASEVARRARRALDAALGPWEGRGP